VAVLIALTPEPSTPAGGPGSQLELAAAGVTIGTMPAVADFPVTLDGVTRRTDADGRVHFDTAASSDSTLSERITPTDAELSIGGQDVKVRSNKLYPFRPVRMLALDLSYQVRFGFSGLSGAPVDPASISTITVKSPVGEVTKLDAQKSAWLQGSRAVSTGSGLAVDTLEWTIQSVEFAGSNVVNASQQRFRPADQQPVAVKLLFFSLSLKIHDALFNHPVGGKVKLVYPDGHAETFRVDGGGQVRITTVPRGQYSLTILGSGPGLSRPLAVSRDQDLELPFYSWWDLATLLGGLAAIAAALAVVGVIRRRRHALDHSDELGELSVGQLPEPPGDQDADVAPADGRTSRAAGEEPDLAVLGDRHTE